MAEHESRTKSSVKIAYTNIIYKIVGLILNFVTRTVFIKVLGEEYFGLNALFSTILNALSLTELGFGSAVTFYLYRPLAENNVEKTKAIVEFFRKIYVIVGMSIMIIGGLLIPVLPYLVNMETELPVNLYLVYSLCVLNSALPYMVSSYTQIVICAMRKGYIMNIINIVFLFISTAGCSLGLCITKSYIVFLMVRLCMTLINNYAIKLGAYRVFPPLREKCIQKVKNNEKREIFNNVKSIFLFRVTSTISNSVDNIVLSFMFGTVWVGFNSNYEMIIVAVSGIVSMIIYSAASNVGNLMVEGDAAHKIRVYREVDLITYTISVISFAGVFNLSNPFIELWLNDKTYVLSEGVVFFKALNMFLVIVLTGCFVFREAMGLFKHGRYRNLIAGVSNLFLTIFLAKIIGLIGVFASTAISALVFAEFVFPKIVFRYGFKQNDVWKEQLRLGVKIIWGIVIAFIVKFVLITIPLTDGVMSFVLRMFITVLLSFILTVLPYVKSDEMKSLVNRIGLRRA